MKVSRIIPAVFALLMIISVACQNEKTYADYLKDEAKAIDWFISKYDFTVLDKFPADSVFKENEFYRDPGTGVYYHIADYGEKDKKVKIGDDIHIRFEGLKYFMIDDSITLNNVGPGTSPFPRTTIYRGPVNSSTSIFYDNPGWIVPIPYVGHKAVVKMIIPFVMGTADDQALFQPTYYDNIVYRFGNYY